VSLNADTNNVNAMASSGLDIGIISTDSMTVSIVPSIGIELLSTAKVRSDYRLVIGSIGIQTTF